MEGARSEGAAVAWCERGALLGQSQGLWGQTGVLVPQGALQSCGMGTCSKSWGWQSKGIRDGVLRQRLCCPIARCRVNHNGRALKVPLK